MIGKAAMLALSLALISAPLPAAQGGANPLAADRWSGTYQNSELRLQLARQAGKYVGTIVFNGDTLPLTAMVKDNALEGTFSLGEHQFTFHAEGAGGTLTFVTDGATYQLQKQGAASGPATAETPPAASRDNGIVGDWRWSEGIFHIGADGNAVVGGLTYRYVLQNNVLVLNGADGKFEFPFELKGDILTLNINGKSTTLPRATASDAGTPKERGRAGSLVGEWHSPNLIIRINEGGTAAIGGTPCRYTVRNNVITFSGTDGNFAIPFEFSGDTLILTLSGKPTTFARGTEQPGQAGGGSPARELVGQWCYMSNVNANNGGSASSTCVTLNANGTYVYHAQSSSTGTYGGVASQSDDSGTWTATENSLSVKSRAYGPITYRLEKRNHPKTRDAMLILDGKAFVTALNRPSW